MQSSRWPASQQKPTAAAIDKLTRSLYPILQSINSPFPSHPFIHSSFLLSTMSRHRPAQHLFNSYNALLQKSHQPRYWTKTYGTVAAVAPELPTATPSSALDQALSATGPRTNWTKEEIKDLYDTPLMKLAFAAVGIGDPEVHFFTF